MISGRNDTHEDQGESLDMEIYHGASSKSCNAKDVDLASAASFGLLKVEKLRVFVAQMLTMAIGADLNDLDRDLWQSKEVSILLNRFISDETCSALYFTAKQIVDEDGEGSLVNYCHSELALEDDTVALAVLLKRTGVLNRRYPPETQLRWLVLPITTEDAYSTLQQLLHFGLGPLLDSKVGASTSVTIDATRKKLVDLEMTLHSLQQETLMPAVHFSLHPEIQRVLDAKADSREDVTFADFEPLTHQSEFLNELQQHVNNYIRQVQKVTQLDSDLSSSTVLQEVKFWQQMNAKLTEVEEMLNEPGVKLTMELLKNAKRFHATVSFLTDTGLLEAKAKSHQYNQLVRDFPVDRLLNATRLEQLSDGVLIIFQHMFKKLKVCSYPVARALLLADAFGRDLYHKVQELVGPRRFIFSANVASPDQFYNLCDTLNNLFSVWEEQSKDFCKLARELTRKRREKFIPVRVNAPHAELQERLSFLVKFRKEHETLLESVNQLSEDGEDFQKSVILAQITKAFQHVRDVDIFSAGSATESATVAWQASEQAYLLDLRAVESVLTQYITRKLELCTNSTQMFRIFHNYRALLQRPAIRIAVQGQQRQLLDLVKTDFERLKQQWTSYFSEKQLVSISQARGLPLLSAKIIRMQQYDRQLEEYLQRIQYVLGDEWQHHAGGRWLADEIELMREQLDTQPMVNQWFQDLEKRPPVLDGPIFQVGDRQKLVVLFDERAIDLYRDFLFLVSLNSYHLPHTVSILAKNAHRAYPVYQSLQQAVKQWSAVFSTCSADSLVSNWLAQRIIKAENDCFLEMGKYCWSAVVQMYTETEGTLYHEFLSCVDTLAQSAKVAVSLSECCSNIVTKWNECENSVELAKLVKDLQDALDSAHLHKFSNLKATLLHFNNLLNSRLCVLIKQEMQNFIDSCLSESKNQTVQKPGSTNFIKSVVGTTGVTRGTRITVKHGHSLQTVSLSIGDDARLRCSPTLYAVKSNYYAILHGRLQQWTNIPVLVLAHCPAEDVELFTDKRRRHLSAELNVKPFQMIENHCANLNLYVATWQKFLYLWRFDETLASFGTNLSSWIKFLEKWRASKRQLDSTDSYYTAGPTLFLLEKIQHKISSKYNKLQHSILTEFANAVNAVQKPQYEKLAEYRDYLEAKGFCLRLPSTGSSPKSWAEFASYAGYLQTLHKELPSFTTNFRELEQAHELLLKFKFKPSTEGWIHIESFQSELTTLKDLFERTWDFYCANKATYVEVVTGWAGTLNGRLEALAVAWHSQKPVSSDANPKAALDSLLVWQEKFTNAKSESKLIASMLKGLQVSSFVNSSAILDALEDEWKELDVAWRYLDQLRTSLEAIENQSFVSLNAAKLKKDVSQWKTQCQSSAMSSVVKQYDAFRHLFARFELILNSVANLEELASPYFTQRHWSRLLQELPQGGKKLDLANFSHWTLGDVASLDPLKYASIFKSILTAAQGERGLAVFLEEVSSLWDSLALSWKSHIKNSTSDSHGATSASFVVNFDELSAQATEHITSLQAMHHSPYFPQFESQVERWERDLDTTACVLQLWSDTQLKFLHLLGVYENVMELRVLLPMETAKFAYTSTEYAQWTQQSQDSGAVVIQTCLLGGTRQFLEKTFATLEHFQKALSKFLDTQRNEFPRFYFLGDDDLLGLIGSAKSPERWSEPLSKIFSGIRHLECKRTSDDVLILGIGSAVSSSAGEEYSGELVRLNQPISMKSSSSIVQALQALDVNVKETLATLLRDSVTSLGGSSMFARFCASGIADVSNVGHYSLSQWINNYCAQICTLTVQIVLTSVVESCSASVAEKLGVMDSLLQSFHGLMTQKNAQLKGDMDIDDLSSAKATGLLKLKVQQLILVTASFRGTLVTLGDSTGYSWTRRLRFYYDGSARNLRECVCVKMGEASFLYGFEYLGLIERLVNTPLTEKCYLTLTTALSNKLGGSPFGPAGTGKTESVKALAFELGQQVLVFNCDEHFDFNSMGRIFTGLCRAGAWGCFDEFNRLKEEILSAVSWQIQAIQTAQRQDSECTLLGQNIGRVRPETALFVTMNPGYSGRSNLPDNLTSLFLRVAMGKADSVLIAESLLFVNGFKDCRSLAESVVKLCSECSLKLSKQKHYDFGLRALKSLLSVSGKLLTDPKMAGYTEQTILASSVTLNLAPQLVAGDCDALEDIVFDCFAVDYGSAANFSASILPENFSLHEARTAEFLNLEVSKDVSRKLAQLYHMQRSRLGVMLVGSSGSGKTATLDLMIKNLSYCTYGKADAIQVFRINPKAMLKRDLYGSLDSITREWNDGWFTSIVRQHQTTENHLFVVFDGEIDPEWVENLNSVLDDNRVFTLPNGERLSLSERFHIIFEVSSLSAATVATISRCGMVYFEPGFVSIDMRKRAFLKTLSYGVSPKFDSHEELNAVCAHLLSSNYLEKRFSLLDQIAAESNDFATNSLQANHCTVLNNFFSSFGQFILNFTQDAENFRGKTTLNDFLERGFLASLYWAMASGLCVKNRHILAENVFSDLPAEVITCHLDGFTGRWVPWSSLAGETRMSVERMFSENVVVSTSDTACHERLLSHWLCAGRSVILCGPPGSGKTMSLRASLGRMLPDSTVLLVQFSSSTTIESVLQALEQQGEYAVHNRAGQRRVVFAPKRSSSLVIFFDEVNLPQLDKYGTSAPVIAWLQQWLETGKFFSPRHGNLVESNRVHIVGACNPPTDPGRVPLPLKLLKNVNTLYVDYPTEEGLYQIYHTFLRAIFEEYVAPSVSILLLDAAARAMVQFFESWSQAFPRVESTPTHYIISPRELTRWARDMAFTLAEQVKGTGELKVSDFSQVVCIWLHSGQRLFNDRLICNEHRNTVQGLWEQSFRQFNALANCSYDEMSKVTFSKYMDGYYRSIDFFQLQKFLESRAALFYEETCTRLPLKIVWHQQAVETLCRVERVLFQVQGHLLLFGPCCSGRSLLVEFACWLAGYTFKTLPIGQHWYKMTDFETDLRTLLKRAACDNETIVLCATNIEQVPSAFLERLNSLLATGDVPDLYSGDELAQLYNELSASTARHERVDCARDNLYNLFVSRVMKNVHVVFTKTTTRVNDTFAQNSLQRLQLFQMSPALLNRCVILYREPWNFAALQMVAEEKLLSPEICENCSVTAPCSEEQWEDILRDSQVNFADLTSYLSRMHENVASDPRLQVVPMHYIEFLSSFMEHFTEALEETNIRQRKLRVGTTKLSETRSQVDALQVELEKKGLVLQSKNEEANKNLVQLIADQQEAESKRAIALQLQESVERDSLQLLARQRSVSDELSTVAPLVEGAKTAVRDIKKAHLTELRSMSNPPEAVKITLEAVCVLLDSSGSLPSSLNANNTGWKYAQSVMRRDDFIASILHYDAEKNMGKDVCAVIRERYIGQPLFVYEAVQRASKACGPLLSWVVSQVEYASILEKVKPLKLEMERLELQGQETSKQAKEVAHVLGDLQQRITALKAIHSEQMVQIQSISSELESVKAKYEKASALLKNLSAEEQRWGVSLRQLSDQSYLRLLLDAVKNAALQTYLTPLDEYSRTAKLSELSHDLENALIDSSVREDMDVDLIAESKADLAQVVVNKSFSLPFRRYPMILDPSGATIEALLKSFHGKRHVVKSSLLEPTAFVKQMETSLRFGHTLVIEDAEFLDSTVTDVLCRERKQEHVGGRTLLKVGKVEVDVSPHFALILVSKSSTIYDKVASFLSSHISVIHCGVTQESLADQALHELLLIEVPEVEASRVKVARDQMEWRNKLAKSEEQLLLKLSSASESNIVEDSELLSTLVEMKTQAKEAERHLGSLSLLLEKSHQESQKYASVSRLAVLHFKIVEAMTALNPLYIFSLQRYIKLFKTAVLKSQTVTNANRSIAIQETMTRELYLYVGRSLSHLDKTIFAYLLHFALECKPHEWEFKLPSITDVDYGTLSGMEATCFGHSAELIRDTTSNAVLESVVVNEARAELAVIFAGVRGTDPGFRVEQFAEEVGQAVESISMGSDESLAAALDAFGVASRCGKWLLLKNVHLCDSLWLEKLLKRMEAGSLHAQFRLIVTVEVNAGRRLSHLRHLVLNGRLIYVEKSVNLKLIVESVLSLVPAGQVCVGVREKPRIYFLVCWCLAGLKRRVQFSPVGWNQADADWTELEHNLALVMVDTFLAKVADQRANLSPAKIPWDGLQIMLTNAIFGAKIDNDKDFATFESLIKRLFVAESFSSDYLLTTGLSSSLDTSFSGLGTGTWEDFMSLVDHIPVKDTPDWVGLDNEAITEQHNHFSSELKSRLNTLLPRIF